MIAKCLKEARRIHAAYYALGHHGAYLSFWRGVLIALKEIDANPHVFENHAHTFATAFGEANTDALRRECRR